MKEYFATTEQAGAWLRVSVCTVQRLTSSVRIQSTKLGAARLFRGSDLLRPIGARSLPFASDGCSAAIPHNRLCRRPWHNLGGGRWGALLTKRHV
jgi:hypothetical protein